MCCLRRTGRVRLIVRRWGSSWKRFCGCCRVCPHAYAWRFRRTGRESLLGLFFREREAVADPRLREKVAGMRGVWFDFLAKLIHEHAEVLDLIAVIGTPHGLQQSSMRDGDVRIRQQVLEEAEFLGRQANLAAAGDDAAGG